MSGEVTEHCSLHSYKVKTLSCGIIRIVHVNKMKKFYPSAQTGGAIFEDYNGFGEIFPTPVSKNETPNFIIDVNLKHLNFRKKKNKIDLICLLDKHQELFS